MGPPGSGKGTQARLLAESRGWVHLSTGDLFRDHIRRDTELGKLAEKHMSKGAYVPDGVTVGMVRERIDRLPAGTGVVFDGFPRTVPQATALDELLRERGRSVGHVVLIEVPPEVIVERLSRRAGSGEVRSDDSAEVVRHRLEVYDEQTRPVLDHYERAGRLLRIDGVGTVEEVSRRLSEAVS